MFISIQLQLVVSEEIAVQIWNPLFICCLSPLRFAWYKGHMELKAQGHECLCCNIHFSSEMPNKLGMWSINWIFMQDFNYASKMFLQWAFTISKMMLLKSCACAWRLEDVVIWLYLVYFGNHDKLGCSHVAWGTTGVIILVEKMSFDW